MCARVGRQTVPSAQHAKMIALEMVNVSNDDDAGKHCECQKGL